MLISSPILCINSVASDNSNWYKPWWPSFYFSDYLCSATTDSHPRDLFIVNAINTGGRWTNWENDFLAKKALFKRAVGLKPQRESSESTQQGLLEQEKAAENQWCGDLIPFGKLYKCLVWWLFLLSHLPFDCDIYRAEKTFHREAIKGELLVFAIFLSWVADYCSHCSSHCVALMAKSALLPINQGNYLCHLSNHIFFLCQAVFPARLRKRSTFHGVSHSFPPFYHSTLTDPF